MKMQRKLKSVQLIRGQLLMSRSRKSISLHKLCLRLFLQLQKLKTLGIRVLTWEKCVANLIVRC